MDGLEHKEQIASTCHPHLKQPYTDCFHEEVSTLQAIAPDFLKISAVPTSTELRAPALFCATCSDASAFVIPQKASLTQPLNKLSTNNISSLKPVVALSQDYYS